MANFDVIADGKIWRALIDGVPSGEIGALKIGDDVIGANLGNGYTSISSRNGSALAGYCKSGILRASAVVVPPPPPPPPPPSTTGSRVVTVTISEIGWQDETVSVTQNKI